MHAVSAHEKKRNEFLCFYAHHARNGTQPMNTQYGDKMLHASTLDTHNWTADRSGGVETHVE